MSKEEDQVQKQDNQEAIEKTTTENQAPSEPAQPQSRNEETLSKKTKETPKGIFKREAAALKKSFFDSDDSKILVLGLAGFALLISVVSLGFTLYSFNNGVTPISVSSGVDGNSANFTEGSIADVAKKVSPSVVSILTETRTMSYFGQDSSSSSAGTGMVISKDGYVLTNKHVVDGASKIQVILDDGTSYADVKVAAVDPLNDVAFLKINNANDLPAVTLGDSKTINVGQQVIAIGNALGQFQNTVTEGIVSGTGRSITATDSNYTASETLNDMIQTDAAINAGNSGGPLVNAAGEVIGINSAVSGTGQGLGFAIPISSVKGMLNSLLKTGSAKRAYLGAYYIPITPSVAAEYNLPVKTGAYIYSASKYSAIISDSPAAKAGLKEKDIITAVNGVEVGVAGSVTSLIGECQPGDTIQVTVLRDGQKKAFNVTLGEYTEQKATTNSNKK